MWKKILIGIIIALLIGFNGYTYYSLNGKINDLKMEIGIDAIYAAYETSNNSMNVYEFSRSQYLQGGVTANEVSTLLGNTIQIHEELITLCNEKITAKKLDKSKEYIISFLQQRTDGFSNLKNALDLSSDDFNSVAQTNFENAEGYKTTLLEELNKLDNLNK